MPYPIGSATAILVRLLLHRSPWPAVIRCTASGRSAAVEPCPTRFSTRHLPSTPLVMSQPQQRSITSFFTKASAPAASAPSSNPLRSLSVSSATGSEPSNAKRKLSPATKPAKCATVASNNKKVAALKKENKDSEPPASKAEDVESDAASSDSAEQSLSPQPPLAKKPRRGRRMISSSSSNSSADESKTSIDQHTQKQKMDKQHQQQEQKTDKKQQEQKTDKKQQEQKTDKKQQEQKTDKQKCSSDNSAGGYNPGKQRYDPIADASWSSSQPVPYLALAKTFEAIEATSSRLRILELLSNFLRSVRLLSPSDLLPCVYLCLNQLAPAYEAVELGVGDSVLMKAMALSTGSTVDKIRQRAQAVGDLGAVSESLRSRQSVMCQPKPLAVAAVFQRLREIASMTGNASQQRKVSKIQGLLVACRQCEAKYLIRSLSGRLRIGLAELSVLSALGHAFARSPSADVPDAAKSVPPEAWKKRQDESALLVRSAFCRCPSYDVLVAALLAPEADSGGLAGLLARCQLRVGVPIKPMLAHPTRGVGEVLKRFDGVDFTCEFKYDGERAQIHRLADGSVRVYSRNQEDNTSKYPDVTARVPDLLPPADCAVDRGLEFILDAEAVAFDTDKRQILPFQVLTTRKRKDADADSIKVQVCVFVFDILYYNGESLVEQPLRRRRQILRDHFNWDAAAAAGRFALAEWRDCQDTEEVQAFLEEAIRGNCEGLMLKALDTDATYEIAKRSHSWLKLKKDYVDGVGDTLDLVVIGGYHGTGKRAGRLGGFLLACYHPEDEEFQCVCKIGTGFSDDELEAFTRDLAQHRVEAPRPYVRCGQADADVWFDPAVVWEVKAADLSLSPAYVAALGLADPRRGISLRFPRFVRLREDKRPEEATTASQLAEMYASQEVVKSAAAGGGNQRDEEEDFY